MSRPLHNFFEKPIIILAAPRSGSTLLFETLSQCKDIWTIGGESHAVFESIPALQVGDTIDSNRLTEKHATDAIKSRIIFNFRHHLQDRNGNAFAAGDSHAGIRLLEKTPKNSLRIPFLDSVFPDALYIYLYRDPRENISSIMEAWRSDRWITYRTLPGWEGSWSLLLPPGWQKLKGRSLERIAAFQWQSANQHIIDDLASIPRDRWTAVSYRQFITDPGSVVKRLCEFMGIEFDAHLDRYTSKSLPLSCFTQTPPASGKWKKNEREINSVLPSLHSIIGKVEETARRHDYSEQVSGRSAQVQTSIARNAPCPCGSGKKYKRCHGMQN